MLGLVGGGPAQSNEHFVAVGVQQAHARAHRDDVRRHVFKRDDGRGIQDVLRGVDRIARQAGGAAGAGDHAQQAGVVQGGDQFVLRQGVHVDSS
ncbi:hypothetical protein G6F57_022403 [Rhizopus arrhizus]|nr:hypothetical protein G6F63_016022 [Rhizopus arrhizus]KAG1433118.1 hypothetical protein G6F57_022403 [Rhizopus arrhizus]